MTLDGAAWMAIFTIFGGFLCVTAYIFERAEPDPISGDRRNQAHPFPGSGEPSIAIVPVPHPGAVGPDGSPDLRERIYRHAAGE